MLDIKSEVIEHHFRHYQEQGDVESMTREAYNMKGLAGQLGMVHRQELAMILEKNCQQNQPDIEDKLTELLTELKHILDGLTKL